MVLLNSIPGSTQSDVEVWTRQIKETLTDEDVVPYLAGEIRRNSQSNVESHGQTIAVWLSRKINWTSERIKQQINAYNGRNKSPQFPPRLEYVDVLQQDHPVWSQVSNSLGDSLLRAKQHAVMLHNMCLRAAEERHLIQADLQNCLLYCQRELGLFEEALSSLGQCEAEPTRFHLGASVPLRNKMQNLLKLQQAFSMLAGDGSVSTDVEEDSESEDSDAEDESG
ncbi:uncharacterized protein LOC123484913 [Coregonus clupeaformis]|uniref:uncharacterized protein LOC123484913 n=1 Tax=Coregonus clupeaformis TaxID=59861 RepID=UPI001E1C5387|nr:uncharacterized protein LOC123484913 [Coregonus clupeaformis]